MQKHILDVKYDSSTGDHYLQFTPDMLAQVGWDFGDTIIWKDNQDGSFTLSKKMDSETSNTQEDGQADGATPPETDRDT
jgi:hypothetical protein